MDSALIVTSNKKSYDFFAEMLRRLPIRSVRAVTSATEARQRLIEGDIDLLVINAPLPDESGIDLALYAADQMAGVLLVVRAESYDEISERVETSGVLTVSKPVNRALFWSSLKMLEATSARLRRMRDEQARLLQKIEEIKLVDRAKCLLIPLLHMTEEEAHHYIEKQAMDQRTSKRRIAEAIIRTYEK